MEKGSISVRELQQNLKRVLARVERGQTIEVTRRRRAVAQLTPAAPALAAAAWPDLEARTRTVFGARLVTPGGTAAVDEGRGER